MIPVTWETVLIRKNREPQGASGLLIEYAQPANLFNPEPQATVSGDAVACGSGLNDSINRPLAAGNSPAKTGG